MVEVLVLMTWVLLSYCVGRVAYGISMEISRCAGDVGDVELLYLTSGVRELDLEGWSSRAGRMAFES